VKARQFQTVLISDLARFLVNGWKWDGRCELSPSVGWVVIVERDA
jgi:hypothetical protein